MAALIAYLGSLVGYLEPVFRFLVQPGIAIGASALIIFAALLLGIWFNLVTVFPVLRQIRRLRIHLKQFKDSSDFAANFSAFDAEISHVHILRQEWQEFRSTLLMPDGSGPAVIRNTCRPADYLNLSGSAVIRLGLPLYQAIPNYFVGVGLLFTFIGLIAGLYFASSGVTNPDIVIAQKAFSDLLNAATIKFMTSIAGLASSILLSINLKSQTVRLQRRIDDLCTDLGFLLEFESSERISLRQLHILEKQREQLERFNTDFAIEVAKALETRLTASLGTAIGQAVSPMVSSIDKMAETLSQQTQQGVSDLVQKFTENLHGSAGREMESVVTALSGLQSTLEGTIGRLSQSGGDFGSKIDAVADRMDALMAGAAEKLSASTNNSAQKLEDILGDIAIQLREQMGSVATSLKAMTEQSAEVLTNSIGGAANALSASVGSAGTQLTEHFASMSHDLNEKLAPLAASLGSVEASLRALDNRLGSQFTEIDRLLGRTRELLGTFDGAAERLRDAGVPITATADKFTLAAGRIDATSQQMGRAFDQIEKLGTALTETGDRFRDSSKLYQLGTAELDEKLGRIFAAMRDATDQYHRSVTDFVTKLDSQFASAANLLRGGIEELGGVVGDLRDAAEAMQPPPKE